ncbi:MAG TPA: hypothetical protein VFZ18_12955 [Longimicrobiaceae bacterium]
MAHHHEHHHDHDEDGEGTYGMAFGFRTVEQGDSLYLVEAEVAPYVDEPGELGATLVFHPLEWVDPEQGEEAEIPAWVIEIDDDLTRRGSDPIHTQFGAIVRQLHGLSDARLLEYLTAAKEEAEEE